MLKKVKTPKEIKFRKMRPSDQRFLHRLYASTRADEMMQVPWSEEEKVQFLKMQFEAQHKFYTEQFTKADFLIVQLEGKSIGRIYLDHREDEIRLIDIALLPEHRGQGLGGKLMQDILAAGREVGKAVRIHVEQFNPAIHLYDRLGFQKIGDEGPYSLLEWTPESCGD